MQPVVVHGLSVCLLVMTMSSAKMAELIGIGTRGPKELFGSLYHPQEWALLRVILGHARTYFTGLLYFYFEYSN